MSEFKLAIVGSTELTADQRRVATWLIDMIIEDAKAEPGELVIISGGASGIDTLAAESAIEHRLRLVEYRPQVKCWEGKFLDGQYFFGFRHRNLQIAEECDTLVSIRSINSKTYGSGWTADAAEGLGKVVRRLYV